jgi:hypothetical protein
MLIRQLRRNYVLLSHSYQRFNLLLNLYQPYENYYNQQQYSMQALDPNNSSNQILLRNLHDSYQTIINRIQKINCKMDFVEQNIGIVQKCEQVQQQQHLLKPQQPNQVDLNELIKSFEYQIMEMNHEYELILEDKVGAFVSFVNEIAYVLRYFHRGYFFAFDHCLSETETETVTDFQLKNRTSTWSSVYVPVRSQDGTLFGLRFQDR